MATKLVIMLKADLYPRYLDLPRVKPREITPWGTPGIFLFSQVIDKIV
jgi:hypothetical protein